MLFFVNDYGEGAHPKILENLSKTNFDELVGYGEDEITKSAKEKIGKFCHVDPSQIFFLTGGTQTNTTVIDSVLKSYEGVITCQSGHINVHESGAVEAFGHKVLSIPGENGKINANTLRNYCKSLFSNPTFEHCVIPGMVYTSFPSEYGTLYSKNELEQLYAVCKEFHLPLFIDGARLGYGLAAEENDVTIDDIVNNSDVFYIGGTKVGALCGEAVVFTKNNMPKHFINIVKRHGALLAKGRLTSVQFDTLFSDNLYLDISKNAIETAKMIKEDMLKKGYRFFIDSPTNQLFPIVSDHKMKELEKNIGFEFWERYDDNHVVIRFVTSWATKKEKVDKLLKLL